MEVYDSNTLNLSSRFPVDGLVNSVDLTSCSNFNCLYIAGWVDEGIHRVQLDGATTRWKVKDHPDGLSVTPNPDYYVLVTCRNACKLKEFTTVGTFVREIRLDKESLAHPLHSIKFDGQFIVSHGWDSDTQSRVCIVNSTGEVTRVYGDKRGCAAGQVNTPERLAIYGDGNVLVADCNNKRVLLLNKTLGYVEELVSTLNSSSSGLEPWRLCLNISRRQLFVADLTQNDPMVFKIFKVPDG